MNKQITEVYTCNCRPNFNWKNKNTFRAHKKSNRHKGFEKSSQEKDHRINITLHKLEEFLSGDDAFEELSQNLRLQDQEAKLAGA